MHDYDPERYIFTGWSDGGAISHSITTPAIVTTYTANFVTQKFLELYTDPPAAGTITATPPSADGYYNVGTSIQLQANPAAGYAFKDWTGDLTGSVNPAVIVLNYWHTITANFAAPTSVTVTTSPPGLAIMVDGTPYTSPHGFSWGVGSSHAIATASPQSEPGHPEEPQRYKFISWSDGGGISHSITTPASTVTYTANFNKQWQLYLTVDPAASGTIVATPSSADGWYNAGQSVQLQANPAGGYGFLNWSGDLTGTANPQTVSSTAYPKSVTAHFGVPTMVRLSLTGGGTGTGQIDANSTFYDLPTSVMCAAGSTANLQAEPANGSVFVRWEGDLTGTTNPTSVLMTAAKTVKAVFALDYRQAKVMVDFAAVGLWMKQGGSWLQLSGVDSDKMVGINADGDPEQETLGDFGTLGVWLLDNGFWTQVSGVNPDAMAAVNIDTDPEEEAAVDFAALGLWLWNAGGWTQLSGVNPDGFIGADADGNGADEIIGDFGAIGLWRWDGAAWTAISLNNVEALAAADGDADGAEEVFGDFGAVGLWIWDGAWSQASASNAQGLLAADMDGDGDQEVFADFGSGGLMVWNSGTWSLVSALDPDGMVAANLEGDAAQELVIDYGANGLRRWSGGSEVLLTGANVEDVIAADMDGDGFEEIVGDFGTLGLWYLPPTNLWEQWSGVNSQGIAAIY